MSHRCDTGLLSLAPHPEVLAVIAQDLALQSESCGAHIGAFEGGIAHFNTSQHPDTHGHPYTLPFGTGHANN